MWWTEVPAPVRWETCASAIHNQQRSLYNPMCSQLCLHIHSPQGSFDKPSIPAAEGCTLLLCMTAARRHEC